MEQIKICVIGLGYVGLPLAALEALCMGVPSLLSDIPPHREIVETLKQDGIEYFSLQSDVLSDKIKTFFSKSYDREGISKAAIQHFSSQTMATKYEALFDEILTKQ